MNVIVMMAGDSKGFHSDGEHYSKFLLEIDRKPMVEHVVDNIQSILTNNKVVFVINQEDNARHFLGNVIKLLFPGAKIAIVGNNVAGAAISSLLAIEHISKDEPLLIINGDQIIDIDFQSVIDSFGNSNLDAGVVVFNAVHPRWSYVKCDDSDYVVEAAEKKPISNWATAGFYYYKKTEEYIDHAKKMILKGAHVNNLYYICPVFNEMILSQKKISTFKIKSEKYHSFMSPSKVEIYRQELKNRT